MSRKNIKRLTCCVFLFIFFNFFLVGCSKPLTEKDTNYVKMNYSKETIYLFAPNKSTIQLSVTIKDNIGYSDIIPSTYNLNANQNITIHIYDLPTNNNNNNNLFISDVKIHSCLSSWELNDIIRTILFVILIICLISIFTILLIMVYNT